MKKLLFISLALGLILSACGTAATQPTLPAQTGTPTITPTTTQTPTSTITPLPIIPTFTPTFDVSTIVTVTPAEKAVCPKEDTTLTPNFPYCNAYSCEDASYHEQVLEFLNAGGTHKSIFNAFPNPPSFPESGALVSKDFTNDGIPELVYSTSFNGLFIFGCANGRYTVLGNIEQIKFSYEILSAKDLNGDGVPEFVIADRDTGGAKGLSIYSWNGREFQSMIMILWGTEAIDVLAMDSVNEIVFRNTNNNGKIEIWMRGGITHRIDFYASGLPWREETKRLSWNGSHFTLSYIEYALPEYRFQALQDADRETIYGRFDKALTYYLETIFNDKLDWWSKERKEFESYNKINSYIDSISSGMSETPTPYPTLAVVSPDPAEYPRLAAYAYYRIMLLYLAQRQEAEAASTYETLQSTFGNDPYAAPYVEMASAFWGAYQSTQRMYDGCAAAIQYAVEHPEILVPLGSHYHGWQAKIYEPADVCPFR